MRKRVSIKIFGIVQGVFFRESTREKANELGLSGFVRNESDGSVYIDAEGSEEDLRGLISWCHQGPRLSRVDRVDYDFIPKLEDYQEFEIRF